MLRMVFTLCALFLMANFTPAHATSTPAPTNETSVTTEQPTATTPTKSIGSPAPAFTATDSNGKTVQLSDFAGKIVVLEWTNNQCPYVRKFYDTGTMQTLQKDATDKGVVWLTVSSSAAGKQGYVTAADANKIIANEKASATAYLLDSSGSLGRQYGAQTSPHMFIIDQQGILAYDGALDDQPSVSHNTVKNANNYVKSALAELQSGQPVTVSTTKPYGCGIKY